MALRPLKRKITLPDGMSMIREFKAGDVIWSDAQTREHWRYWDARAYDRDEVDRRSWEPARLSSSKEALYLFDAKTELAGQCL